MLPLTINRKSYIMYMASLITSSLWTLGDLEGQSISRSDFKALYLAKELS